MLRRAAFGLLLVTFLPSCNTPKSICNDMVMSLDDMFARCGYPNRIELFFATGEEATCDDVNEVDNPGQLLNDCIPWAQEASCEELPTTTLEAHGCDFSLLKYYPPDS